MRGFLKMSKIGKNSIQLPEGSSFTFENNILSIKGKQGNADLKISNLFKIEQKENEIFVIPKNTKDKSNPLWGTTRALVANTLKGTNTFFTKTLELNGTGYRASVSGSVLKLQVGLSHDIEFQIPKEVKIECPKQNIIKISSILTQQKYSKFRKKIFYFKITFFNFRSFFFINTYCSINFNIFF